MIDYTLLTLAIALLAVTVLGKVRLHDWWIRACEFPRVQIVSLAVLVAFAALWLGNDGLQKWGWCLRCSCTAFCRGHAYGPCRCNQRSPARKTAVSH